MTATAYQSLLDSITEPDGQRLIQLLSRHVGADHRADRQALVLSLYGMFTPNADRKFRALVARLQNEGVLILSDSAEGGFWMAASLEEVHTFIASEIDSRIARLGEKKSKLLDHARRHFGQQMPLQSTGSFW